MHQRKKIRNYLRGDLARGGAVGKAVVMGMLERHSKQVRAIVLPEVKKRHTDEQIRDNVEPGTKLYTDEAVHYEALPDYMREFFNHTEEYVHGAVHTNCLENFWSLLKRSLAGTYISVEPFHLQANLNEQAYQFNNRKATPAERFADVMTNVYGNRLTRNEVTGKEQDARPPVVN